VRITTRLRIISSCTIVALIILAPILIWASIEFRSAKNDYALAEAIKINFFERAAFRDQYFLYREDRARVQWDKNKEAADSLLDQAKIQFHDEADRQNLERLRKNIEDSAVIFHRIVDNTEVLKKTANNRYVYEELDKRLSSQLLLRASSIRDMTTALQDACAWRVEQTYKHLNIMTGMFLVMLALTTILTSIQLNRLIRKRLSLLHDGAKIVADGNLDYRIQCDGKDEFAELAVSINFMTDRLQAFTLQLEMEISQRKRLAQEREQYFRFFRLSMDPMCITDQYDCFKQINPTFIQLTGFEENELLGKPFLVFILPEDRQRTVEQMMKQIKASLSLHFENRFVCKDGGFILLSWTAYFDQSNGVTYAAARDITETRQAEQKLHLAANVFTHAREGIMITAADGTIIDVNEAFTLITGYSHEEVLGYTPRILKSGRHDQEFYATLWRNLVEKGHWYGEVWNRRKNGEVYAEMITVSAIRDTQGNIRQYVALFSDITTLKEHEQQLEHIAHYDALTSLPNRVLLADRLRQAMAQTQRRGQILAIAYLDLDGFKAINDNHGHEAGDQLLMSVANGMKQTLREGDTLARMGGDEFVAVLPDLADIESSIPMLARLLAAAAQPVQAGDDLIFQVSTSLGVTFYPQAEDVDADQLLRQADQAMYQAKLAGKNRYHVYDAEQDNNIRGHYESLNRIRDALAAREFVLHYQPKVNMRSGKVIGAEALIRWQHPENGLLPPAEFLPVIEDHPLAVEIGEWVIETALTQIERWHNAGLDIPVSVNVGARQLQQTGFVERLREILAAHPTVRPSCLELEVLETSALEDIHQVSLIIETCREIGVTFALDDFGTGYSSLTYLKRLPVTLLKIDQSFVRDMLDDPDDLAILDGVLGLAIAFGRQVIAEGVETLEHGEMLLQLGCEMAQGYGIARPMPADEMPRWSAAWRTAPAWIDLSPVSRADLPLLFAGADFRAWIVGMENHIKGRLETPPPLDHHRCRFGRWLDTDGLARYGAQPNFQAIETLHHQVHVLAAELLDLRVQGRNPEALAKLYEFQSLGKALLKQLKILAQGNRNLAGLRR
jgi:diguanylate cyclase (GGDEF)-like protein/PAS domain S-box-containing protein